MVVASSVVEFDRVWVVEGLGEADLRMLDSDLWWPNVERPVGGGWCDQPVTATILFCHALLAAAI